MKLVELRPLKPFVGTYKCSLSEADLIDDALTEKDGVIVKEKVPKKRYIGLVPVERAATADEFRAWKEGKLPSHLTASEDGRFVTEMPIARTVKVPEEVAQSLVARGLAERIGRATAAWSDKQS
jgi:hypothetical protein